MVIVLLRVRLLVRVFVQASTSMGGSTGPSTSTSTTSTARSTSTLVATSTTYGYTRSLLRKGLLLLLLCDRCALQSLPLPCDTRRTSCAGAFAPELNGSPVVGRQRRRFQRRPRTIRGLLQHCTWGHWRSCACGRPPQPIKLNQGTAFEMLGETSSIDMTRRSHDVNGCSFAPEKKWENSADQYKHMRRRKHRHTHGLAR